MIRSLIVAATLCAASTASAQPAGDAVPLPGDVSTTAGTPAADWPAEMQQRPFTLPKAGIAAYGDVDISHAAVGTAGFTQEQLHLGGAYGVNDKLTAGLELSLPLAGDASGETRFRGPIRFFGMYALKSTAKLTVAAEAHLELNLCGSASVDAATMTSSCDTTAALAGGLDARYMVGKNVAVFTGAPFGPGVPGAVGGLVFPGVGAGGVGQHLEIGLGSSVPTSLAIPVGVSLQARPKIFAYLETVFLDLYIANKGGHDTLSVLGTDSLGIPTIIGAFYNVNKNLDAGLNLFDDLKHPGDFLVVALAARWRK